MFKIDTLTNIYLVSTLGLVSYTLYDTYTKSDNYFSMWLNYLDNSMTNFIFYNFIISLGIIVYKLNILAFFSQVKQNETFKVLQKLRNKIIDLIMFLYISGGNFTFQVFACIVFIFLLYICHYQAVFRSQYLIHTPTALSLNLNYRLLANFLILAFFDFEIVSHNIDLLYSDQPAKFMFIYYILIISLSLVQPMVLFLVDFYEKYTFTHIQNGDQILAHVSIYINVPRLVIQIALSIWMLKFNLTIWMIFIIIQHSLQINGIIKSYNRIKKLTDTMKNLKRVSQEELKQYHDQTCMVCFQDIKQAVLLPCKHIFHDQCLRQWIIKNANHFCPKCKKQFNFQKKKDENAQPMNLRHIPFGRRLNANNLGQLGDQNLNENFNNYNNQNFNQRRQIYANKYNINQLNQNNHQNIPNRRHVPYQNRPNIQSKNQNMNKSKFQTQYQQRYGRQAFNKNANNGGEYQRYQIKNHSKQAVRNNQRFYPQNKETKFGQTIKQRSRQEDQREFQREERQNYPQSNYSHQNVGYYQNIMLNPVNLMSLDTPLQVLQLKKRLMVRIGSLPYGMPTQAVHYRTARHMIIRQRYQRANQDLVRNLSCTPQEQMLLLADN